MTITKEQIKSDSDVKDPYLIYKRRITKDTLLADNPPRILAVAIALVAVFLTISVMSLRWIEYQETVAVTLTLKTVDGTQAIYGEAYLRPGEMTKVQIDQVVKMELSRHPSLENGGAQATVREIKTVSENALYVLRVDVPAGLLANSGGNSTFQEGMQVQGKIVTQKQNLFDKLFSFFRMIAHGI